MCEDSQTPPGVTLNPEDVVHGPGNLPDDHPDGEFHRIVSNGLHIFGKAEQWTLDEIRKFVAWLRARL